MQKLQDGIRFLMAKWSHVMIVAGCLMLYSSGLLVRATMETDQTLIRQYTWWFTGCWLIPWVLSAFVSYHRFYEDPESEIFTPKGGFWVNVLQSVAWIVAVVPMVLSGKASIFAAIPFPLLHIIVATVYWIKAKQPQ
ncbi:hypothetical protein A3B57_03170 [Microgenomates group bacterium RIFCSPLOWO2_01_FULL_47_10]|nr:MAG: hypothetical protein A3B57_03170 [Microgenomates group bacterium RIFCSPLOWO2_01_FULL_47_10]